MTSKAGKGGAGLDIAPIALFVFNRPAHTSQTISALRKNELASHSDLYVFADAARNEGDAALVGEVRRIIREIEGFRSVTIIEQLTNQGLATSIISGVTRLCSKYGKVIVVEDDLVTSRYFLQFMNDALDCYASDRQVMHISGSTYPLGDICRDNTCFLRVPLCWGWATWERAWRSFSNDLAVMDRFDRKARKHFDFNNTYTYWKQLELNRRGVIRTWFVFWYATLFLQGGLALFPRKSLVKNIGMDGSGVHCGLTDEFNIEPSTTRISVERIPIEESAEAYKLHLKYFSRTGSGFYARSMRLIRTVSARVLLPFAKALKS